MASDEQPLPLHFLKCNPDNKLCFDCPAEQVTHVVIDFSTFVCRDCAQFHTESGRKAKSIMGMFTKEEIARIESGGNLVALIVYLFSFDGQEITPHVTPESIKQFMDEKYVQRKWYNGEVEQAARAAQLADNKAYLVAEAAEARHSHRGAVNDNTQCNTQKVIYGVAKGNPVGRTRAFNQVTRQRSESQSRKSSTFIIAADAGNLEEVRKMLDAGTDVNLQNDSQVCALHRAAAKGHGQIVSFLIARGANADLRDKWLDTSLHKACHNGHATCVKALIDGGANVNLKNNEQRTPIMVTNNAAIVKLLTDAGAISATDMAAASSGASNLDAAFPAARKRGRSFGMQDNQRPNFVGGRLDQNDPFSGFKATALYDFKAEYKNELDVGVGQVVTVIDEHPPAGQGWWLCSHGGSKGLVPASYVQINKDSVAQRGAGGKAGARTTRDRKLSHGSYAAAWTQSRPPPRPKDGVELFNAVAVDTGGGGLLAAPPPASRRRANSLRRPGGPPPFASQQPQRRASLTPTSNTTSLIGAPPMATITEPAAAPAQAPPPSGGGLLDLDWSSLPAPTAPAPAPAPAAAPGGSFDLLGLGTAPSQQAAPPPSMNDLMSHQNQGALGQPMQPTQPTQGPQGNNPFF